MSAADIFANRPPEYRSSCVTSSPSQGRQDQWRTQLRNLDLGELQAFEISLKEVDDEANSFDPADLPCLAYRPSR